MNRLVPCPSCRRHVALAETRCPFCESELDLSGVSPRPLPKERMSRAAAFTFGASMIAAAACGGATEGGPNTDGADGDETPTLGGAGAGGRPAFMGQAGAVYGAPIGGTPLIPMGQAGAPVPGAPVYGAPIAGAPFGATGGVYGAPPIAGRPNQPNTGGAGGAGGDPGELGASAGVYGAPPFDAGAGGASGNGGSE